jgi:Flp pilus assembly protein TadD
MLVLPFAILVNWPMLSKATMEAPTHFNIGYELERRDELVLAKEFYLAALAMDKTNPLVLNNLGMVAMKQSRPDDAIKHFNAAVDAKPDNWDARINLGIALWRTGRTAEAVRQYERVIKAEPDYNPVLYFNIACFHSLEGRTKPGIDWLRKAIEHGYNNWGLIQEDPDLDNLRQLPEFIELLEHK